MPLYEFKCEQCQETITQVLSMKGDIPESVPCVGCNGIPAYRVWAFNAHDDSYNTPLVSDALAVHPSQVEEHRRKFPNIKVRPDGRPEFTSFSQHDAYLKATGFHKKPQKNRPGVHKIYKKAVQTD